MRATAAPPVAPLDAEQNRRWLRQSMAPSFFEAMADQPEALGMLERELGALRTNQHITLADRPKALVLATLNLPGSLYETLRTVQARNISYAMFAHSTEAIPGTDRTLEIQRFEFDRKEAPEVAAGREGVIPAGLRGAVAAALRKTYPDFDTSELDPLLALLWANAESYVRISPPRRVAQTLRLLQLGERAGGLYLDVEEPDEVRGESSVFFAVANPPPKGFLIQVMEVLNRLDLGVKQAYCLTISTENGPYFLGAFYVRPRQGGALQPGSALHTQLERELFNTQVLATASPAYLELVTAGVMSGEDASLVNAFTAFCHTNLAHAQPDRFNLEDVSRAFHSHPDIALQLTRLFELRFDPEIADRRPAYEAALAAATKEIEEYNTGHRQLDEFRRTIFRTTLSFVRRTLKTNFFVPEKHALAFRLDPAYLDDLGPEFTSDLPAGRPFRVTFFFGRNGLGYHIGFSDIARGGWRTVIARTQDDFITSANTLFRENFVLAYTQHLKNKDIYEGGSKMVVVINAPDLQTKDRMNLRLHKVQYAFINAFLDIFVTENGKAKDPRVVDYYGEDEPIELGPDENMHDEMIEQIAQLSKRRGYLLGIGVMSSKEVGINHKEYGVTSTGVVKFAEIAMREMGVDIRTDPFSVKFTGGPNGDVAGNAMRILLDRCPKAAIRLILDGTAALARKEGLRELFRKATRTGRGVQEEWISVDELSRQFGELAFTVQADLFIPGGGRPETIDRQNWQKFLLPDGTPSARAIVEGANSFITPEARVELQKKGVLLMRDASANKCGVISSSYEIIANLVLTEEEFLTHKERYVADVLAILERRAADEARLILARRRATGQLCTEISDSLSREINGHYARLFKFFEARPELAHEPLYQRALLSHLPAILRQEQRFRRRIEKLPQKYLSAILAAEIGSSLVYRGDREADFEDAIRLHVERSFPAQPAARTRH